MGQPGLPDLVEPRLGEVLEEPPLHGRIEFSVDVKVDVRTPGSRTGPEPEDLPLAEVKEDADGSVAPARTEP